VYDVVVKSSRSRLLMSFLYHCLFTLTRVLASLARVLADTRGENDLLAGSREWIGATGYWFIYFDDITSDKVHFCSFFTYYLLKNLL